MFLQRKLNCFACGRQRPLNGRLRELLTLYSMKVSVPGFKIDKKDVFYYVKVDDRPSSTWLLKRFSQFAQLYHLLQSELLSDKLPALPPKHPKILVKHEDKHFIETRRLLLERFLIDLASNPRVVSSDSFKDFISSHVQEPPSSIRTVASLEEKSREGPFEPEVTRIHIPAVKQMSDHVLYQIFCANDSAAQANEWVSLKRFADFCSMDRAIRRDLEARGKIAALNLIPALPSKSSKFLIDHEDPGFIEERRLILENYLTRMIDIREVQENDIFLRFLNAK